MMQPKPQIAGRFIAISLFMLATACAHQPMAAEAVARASLVDAQGQNRGTATIMKTSGKLAMELDANGIPGGVHAIHLHQVGKCDAPKFDSAGPHWNPADRKHGLANSAGAHAGDFPNIEAGSSGKVTASFPLEMTELKGGAASLIDTDGAAVVIHAKPDDNVTDPSGNSGDRIICGVIQPIR